MSLHRHLAHKEDILDGVFAADDGVRLVGGHAAARISARGVHARHRWATALLESRANPRPGRCATTTRCW